MAGKPVKSKDAMGAENYILLGMDNKQWKREKQKLCDVQQDGEEAGLTVFIQYLWLYF